METINLLCLFAIGFILGQVAYKKYGTNDGYKWYKKGREDQKQIMEKDFKNKNDTIISEKSGQKDD